MDERWQALQRNLAAARVALDAGNRSQALHHINAALAIDPQFLAAQALRERINSAPETAVSAPPPPIPQPITVAPAVELSAPISVPKQFAAEPVGVDEPPLVEHAVLADTRVDHIAPLIEEPAVVAAPAPTAPDPVPIVNAPIPVAAIAGEPEPRRLVSTEGYARFEARAKRRRVDRRVEAARIAIDRGRLKDAAAAIDEIVELDRNLPELRELTAAFDTLRRSRVDPHRGPWLAAAAAFAGIVLGASWLQESRALLSHPMSAVAALVTPIAAVTSTASADALEPEPVATSGDDNKIIAIRPAIERAPRDVARAEPEPALLETAPARSAGTVAETPAVVPAVAPAVAAVAPPAAPVPPPPAAPPPPSYIATPAPAPVAAPAGTAVVPPPTPDEEGLIKQALQRYRSAYEGLDAQSAQAVYPAVNEAALARAFDGLASQSLTFETCNVQLRGGEAATATCRGSARYVPKVGSHEPRTEPRVWNFTLRKAGAEWKIDTARAQR